jgi:pyruvate,orthophosphate dikinase
VVSRALDTPCVTGCGDGTVAALLGRTVTVDATSGRVYAGELGTCSVDESSDEDLRRLTGWAEQAVAVRVTVADDDAVAPVLDADAIPPEELGEQLPPIPAGTRTVRGALFATPDGVRAALDAGVEVIVTPHRLPVLLTAAAHQEGTP